jgi:hypothetical protein
MTLARPVIEFISDAIRFFILGIVLMDRRGRKILNMRKIFKLDVLALGMKSAILINTTKKSSQFHLDRK